MSQSGKAVWSLVTAMAVAFSLWSVGISDGTYLSPGCCLGNSTCENVPFESGFCGENSTFSEGEVCADDNQSCRPALVGCCADMEVGCLDNVQELDCLVEFGASFDADAVCDIPIDDATTSGQDTIGSCVTFTPTTAPTATPTATPTNTRVPEGGTCTETGDCEEGLVCLDGVCGEVAAPAPTASAGALAVGFMALLLVAAVSLGRRRRSPMQA